MTLALETQSRVIVSGPASPFCHAANVLRVLAEARNPIEWWTLDEPDLLPVIPQSAFGTLDRSTSQTVLVQHETLRSADVNIPLCNPWDRRGAAGNSVAFAPSGTWSARVAMSARCYDRLTASIMIPGLAESALWVTGHETSVKRADSGQLLIWNDGIRSEAMVEILADRDRSEAPLSRLTLVYGELLREWATCRDLRSTTTRDLEHSCLMLRKFFSVLLLLHTSYTQAISVCLVRIGGPHLSDDATSAAVPEILRWQVAQSDLLPAAKDLLEAGQEVSRPPFTLEEDLALTFRRIVEVCNTSDRHWCFQLARISVLKEWKFFLAKVLHRHFAVVLRALLDVNEALPISCDEHLRSMSIHDLVESLEEKRSVVRGQPE
jgi:hypothetical protein